jgi:hypothetical protein
MKKITKVKVFELEECDGEWPPENGVECVKWFAEKIESIPLQNRGSAKIEIEGVSGYEGESYGRISITYFREETDAEEEMRETTEAMKLDRQKNRELEELHRLKAKYNE